MKNSGINTSGMPSGFTLTRDPFISDPQRVRHRSWSYRTIFTTFQTTVFWVHGQLLRPRPVIPNSVGYLIFNYTLRSDEVSFILGLSFSYPPSTSLRATGLGLSKTAACNIGAGGYTERHFMHQTYLTEPQGIIKNLQHRRRRI